MRNVDPQEWEVRCDLAAAYRLVAHFDMDDLIFTHLSARLPGKEHRFLLNPYGLMFDEITASSLVVVDPEGHAIEKEEESKINNAGFTIHSAVHMSRDDAQTLRPGNGLDPPAHAQPVVEDLLEFLLCQAQSHGLAEAL